MITGRPKATMSRARAVDAARDEILNATTQREEGDEQPSHYGGGCAQTATDGFTKTEPKLPKPDGSTPNSTGDQESQNQE